MNKKFLATTIFSSLLLTSCASMNGVKRESKHTVNIVEEKKVSTYKELSLEIQSLSKATDNKEYEIVFNKISKNDTISLQEKSNLITELQDQFKVFHTKRKYIESHIDVNAKFEVETTSRIAELTGHIDNTGNKIITSLIIEIKSKNNNVQGFPRTVELTGLDSNPNKFSLNEVFENIPQEWSKEIVINIKNVHFYN